MGLRVESARAVERAGPSCHAGHGRNVGMIGEWFRRLEAFHNRHRQAVQFLILALCALLLALSLFGRG